ncbi:ABC transporter permease subunit [Rubeoparvulum massiliense]|uniref:ABC transporter permease subunit n=1 Tax=Rubeoparvulum massiliense TaxID=1631346 RepID=UPI00164E991C|nr:ABC transporter permease subunit [Rubeoparvulum massiliense]
MNIIAINLFKTLFRNAINFLLVMIGITMIVLLPTMFFNAEGAFTPLNYLHNCWSMFSELLTGDFGTYYPTIDLYLRDVNQRSIIQDLLPFMLKSAKIFIPGLLLGIGMGILIAFIFTLFGKKARAILNRSSVLLISFPDFVIIVLLQVLFITINQKTGIRFVSPISSNLHGDAWLLPVLSLSVLPMFLTIRFAMEGIQEVYAKDYILLAYSKGLNRVEVLIKHVLANVITRIFSNFTTIFMMVISNLVIVEQLFNTKGISFFYFDFYPKLSEKSLIIMIMVFWLIGLVIRETTERFLKKIERNYQI